MHKRCQAEHRSTIKCQGLINSVFNLIPASAWFVVFFMLVMMIIIGMLIWLAIIKLIWVVAVIFQQIGLLGNWLRHEVCGCPKP